MNKYALAMLISGGQTGVDRSALDFALTAGIHCSGWCPKGRRAEDEAIPSIYPLKEASSQLYQQRTRLNVRDSDATLIITDCNRRSRGTALTVQYAVKLGRPCLVVDIGDYDLKKIRGWLKQFKPQILNLAGPRASESPESAAMALKILNSLFVRKPEALIDWPPRRPYTPRLFFSDTGQ